MMLMQGCSPKLAASKSNDPWPERFSPAITNRSLYSHFWGKHWQSGEARMSLMEWIIGAVSLSASRRHPRFAVG